MVQAHGGSLFLDELGELPLELQPKLLRALESRQVRPVGGSEVIPTDVRIIAATNRSLEQMVKEGSFRQDLYYRLAVIHVPLPPLRDRVDDIPFLVDHFLRDAGRSGPGHVVSHATMEKLKSYPWPGNVRELSNYVERAKILSSGSEIDASLLPDAPAAPLPSAEVSLRSGDVDLQVPFKLAKEQLVDRFEREYLTTALRRHDWNITRASQAIGLHRKSLEYLVKKHNLRDE